MAVSFQFEVVKDHEQLGEVARAIARSDAIGLDLETTSFSPHDGKIRCCQINAAGKTYVVDAFETKTLDVIVQAMRDAKKTVVCGQALKFEQKWFLENYGLELWPVFDTYRASNLIHNGRQAKHDLYSIWDRELGYKPQSQDLQKSNWAGPLTQAHYEYAAEDVIHLPALRDKMKPQLSALGLLPTALIEFEVILPEAAAENSGFYLDRDSWVVLAHENEIRSKQLYEELLRELPNPSDQMIMEGIEPYWNLDSPTQILSSLRRLGIKLDNTREMTLAPFAAKHPVLKKFMDYREVSKQLSSFGLEFLEHINPVTGRIHCSYFPFTGAGRYACSDPNLQQIPRGKRFRACFKAAPGKVLVLADYSGIEMRIVAEIADDKELINVFKTGQDAHYATAAIIMEKEIKEISKNERQMAKPVNFGFIYGMMPAKLVLYAMANYGVSMSEGEAAKFRKRYFDKYYGIAAWHKRAQRDGQRAKSARTIGGRLRYLEDEGVYNEYYNTPVQGTGADALKRSLKIVYKRLKECASRARIVHHVHDEIIVEADNDPELISFVKKQLHDGMIEGMQPYLRKVPVEVEPNHGPDWASAK